MNTPIQNNGHGWEHKGMRLKPDTMSVYEFVKEVERYTDNEMMEFLLAGLLYLKSNRVKFTGWNRGMPKEEIFNRLMKYYGGNPILSKT